MLYLLVSSLVLFVFVSVILLCLFDTGESWFGLGCVVLGICFIMACSQLSVMVVLVCWLGGGWVLCVGAHSGDKFRGGRGV